MVVLEPRPGVFLIAMFLRGFWLEVTTLDGKTRARYLLGKNVLRQVQVAQA